MKDNAIWRFCLVGNVKKSHIGSDGKTYYGTKAFTGGTKIYIDDRLWSVSDESIDAIGRNRFGKYVIEPVPTDLIENIRVKRVFKPVILKIMSYVEEVDGWPWRGRTAKDKKELDDFVKMKKSTDL